MIGVAALALGLVLLVEGLAYALAPSLIERMLVVLRQLPIDQRRLMGLAAMALGLVLIWLGKSLGA
ncbi:MULTISPECIES: DUF2065 family protein [Roseovarius]|jgi:hypothetical protein|uniref:Cytochrome b561 domain-containing protein n=1 Tax=Roseovarius nubinhibens (strain ATCC BAA-591 / DSM 15170 / ISM) TaxID=89187 RepID=A3SMC4_ROSNI|nr:MULTISPECIES: DUF2065 family protein [Roseovarius]EAP75614.1 hypothetical protein ISM_12150 [Roseovarius nubinhibens ISM]MBU2998892.1 DUF2065 family protein [Roseovarius nubinhibens]|tara:strand:+ start:496 stop:693 length:198 start_codon:yes stop_codon:yes gene_type:complete